jgi:Cu/Ag efflux protein CusF
VDATYDVRGQVVDVPREGRGDLTVHHETIAEFRDRDGKPSEMESMTMPFAVAPGVSLAGIAPGDKVEMTFEVRWEGIVPLRVVALRELPESTALALGGAPTLELVQPFGTPSPGPSPAATPTPSARPATDGPSAPPSETI